MGKKRIEVRFDEAARHWIFWEDGAIRVVIQRDTNFPAEYGGHLVVEQKSGVKTPYGDYRLFARMAVVAAAVQKALEETGLAPHANIQSNANWGFRNPDGTFRTIEEGRSKRSLHLHVYGRKPKDPNWAEPVRPAYHAEQQAGKYFGKVFSAHQMERVRNFLQKEIPEALHCLER